jgi:hypothetical protein
MADGTIDVTADRVVLNDADLLVASTDLEQTLALLPG